MHACVMLSLGVSVAALGNSINVAAEWHIFPRGEGRSRSPGLGSTEIFPLQLARVPLPRKLPG